MGPNDADIIRVYTREGNGTVADNTLDPNIDGKVVVDPIPYVGDGIPKGTRVYADGLPASTFSTLISSSRSDQ